MDLERRSGPRAQEQLGSCDFLEVRYEELLAEPRNTCGQIEQFLQLDHDQAMHDFAHRELQRRNKQAGQLAMPEHVCTRTTDLLTRLEFN